MQITTAVEQFLSHCRYSKKLSDHTLRAYHLDLNCFLKHAGTKQQLIECDKTHLREYLRYLFEVCELKATSVKRRFACLKAMFRWLETEETINENPFRKMDLKIRLPSRLPRGLSEDELHKLLNTPLKQLGLRKRSQLNSKRCTQFFQIKDQFRSLTTLVCLDLLFATGIRVGELAAIELNDINTLEKTIRIHGKGDRERLVFLPGEELANLLNSYLSARKQIINNKQLINTTRNASADTQYIRLLIRRTGETAKLNRRITPHMLRHSTATHLLNSGIDIRFVQRLLGHQSITTTQIYTQVGDAMLKQIVCEGHPMGRIVG